MNEYIEKKAVIVDNEFEDFFKALLSNDLSIARQIIEEIKNNREPQN